MHENGLPRFSVVLPASTVAAATAGLAGAWLAAGSTGLMAESLRVALTWLVLLFSLAVARPPRWRPWLLLVLCVLLAQPLVVAGSAVHEILLVTAVLSTLAACHAGGARRAFSVCAFAAFALALYRLSLVSIPAVWHLSDAIGVGMGNSVAWVSGCQLEVGATFAGLDLLVTMAALWLAWVFNTEGRRWPRAAWAGFGILVAHALYLLVLAYGQNAAMMLPDPPQVEFVHPYVPPDWHWVRSVRPLIPWSYPAIGAALHLGLVVLMMRWARWGNGHSSSQMTRLLAGGWLPHFRVWAYDYGTFVMAVLLAVSAVLSPSRADLSGKQFIAYRDGFLDWQKPRFGAFGQASAGQFGMLSHFIESLGGQLRITSELTAAELDAADVAILLHPADDLPSAALERLDRFVRRGGALLVVGEPYLWDGMRRSGGNAALARTPISIRRDVATSESGRWQQSLQTLTHPATRAIGSRDRSYFSDAGASLCLGWSSVPLAVGRWGWSDHGSDSVYTASSQFEPGERLGDLVLVGEQRLGRGRIVVMGDDVCFTNEGLVFAYEWTGRLLSYLAAPYRGPQTLGRPIISLLLGISLLVLIGWWRPEHLVQVALLLTLSISVCQELGQHAGRVIPDGTRIGDDSRPNRLAYIDASHMESYSRTDWGFDSVNGLALTLMRDGYLAVAMPETSKERLARAAMVVSIAPSRPFTQEEVRILYDYVREGGVLVCAVGAEQAAASEVLLAEFGIRVPASPVPTGGHWREPKPMGRFRSLYLDARDYGAGDYKAGVLFHAGWPVESTAPNIEVLVRGQQEEPIVVTRRVGSGAIVVIGDSDFPLNKNLEYVTGDAFEGRFENAAFWRWLLSRITDRPEWVPTMEMAGHAEGDNSDQEATP